MLYIMNLNKTTPKKFCPEHCMLQLVPQEDILQQFFFKLNLEQFIDVEFI